MNTINLRHGLCWALIAAFPASVLAADSTPAVLYAKGEAWINGASVPKSSAIFPGDLVQTRNDAVVHIDVTGSRVQVLSGSLVKYEGDGIGLEHGGVTVVTSKGMTTQAGEVKVSPASGDWTEFRVTDVDGTVQIVAEKGNLTINDGQHTSTLSQGQQTTRDESQDPDKKKKKRRSGAAEAATGSILNSTGAIIVGTAAVGGVAAWVLIGRNDDPVSPSK